MTESQYGVQGAPMQAPRYPEPRGAEPEPEVITAAAEIPALVDDPETGVVATYAAGGDGMEPADREVFHRATQWSQVYGDVTGLVTKWENAAQTTLISSTYQEGQRDALLACIADLRARLGI